MLFSELFKKEKVLIAMIHLLPLPGTPKYGNNPEEIIKTALQEAKLYKETGIKAVMIENMHDIPYTKKVGPEITAFMSTVGRKIKEMGLYCGVQVLAGCNKEAMAVALAGNLDFIRAEGFVFGHIGDEGYMDANGGELLRYRRMIGGDHIKVFCDIKKKHSSHAITQDLDIAETAKAAEFFGADGIIITGSSTGIEPNIDDLKQVASLKITKLIGSGINPENFGIYRDLADIFIVGSYFKKDGLWSNAPDPARIEKMIRAFK